jgi:hypothetical protein
MHFSSVVYTTKWPFSTVDDVLQSSESILLMVCGKVILFPLITASFLHFLANLTSFLARIILRPIKLRKGVVWTLEYWNATLLLDGRKWKWVDYIYTKPIPLPTPSTQLDTCKAKPCESLVLWGGHVCPCWSMEVCILACFQSSKRSNFCVSWSSPIENLWSIRIQIHW